MEEQTKRRPKHWINYKRLKEDARFEPVLAHYGLVLTARGFELVGHCPFHDDKEPSFAVNPEKRVFNCFGCDAKGNVLDFVMLKEGVGVRKAAKLVMQWCGLNGTRGEADSNGAVTTSDPSPDVVSDSTGSESGNAQADAATCRPADGPETVNKPLSFALKLESEHPYFSERGILPGTVSYYGLGYSTRGIMKGRIAIPIHDENGDLVAYAGRWVGTDDSIPESEGKYKLPPNFQKQAVLYNLHRITADAQALIIVEGFFSVFWLRQCGYPNVVALMGCSLSEFQKSLLCERFQKRWIFLFLDGVEAGREATRKITEELSPHLWVKVIACPAGKQPDQLAPTEIQSLLS